MHTDFETVARPQPRQTLLGSVMIGVGIALIVLSSAFFLGSGPAAGIEMSSADVGPAADAGLTDAPTGVLPADGPSSDTVDRLLVEMGDGLPASADSALEAALPEAAPVPPPPPIATLVPAAVLPVAPAPAPLPTVPPPVPPTVLPPTPTPLPPPPPTPTPLPPPPPASLSGFEADILAGINGQRVAAGLAPLQLDSNLVMVARERSNDMVQKGYFGHVSPTGDTAFSIMDRYGIPYAWAGENLARNNYPDNESVAVALRDWMASQGHRDNILGINYQTVGVGAAVDGAGMKYFTLVFVGF